MFIDLTSINNGSTSKIIINDSYNIPAEYLEDSEIIGLKNENFDGILTYIEENFSLTGKITGTMILEDSISLEPIEYDFSIEIDEDLEENLEKSQNILDITDILWQNIVLEVPLKLTNVDNFDEYHGDGWRLISEDSIENTNNPFKELKDMLGEE